MPGNSVRGVLVTRPAARAATLAETIRGMGFTPFISPLLRYVDTGNALPVTPDFIDAIAFTSSEGVAAFSRLAPDADFLSRPALAVGPATAAAARAAGFGRVLTAPDGSARSFPATLVNLPQVKNILHISGRDVTTETLFPDMPVRVIRHIAYDAVAIDNLEPQAQQAITDGAITHALFFSVRTAAQFTKLLPSIGGGTALSGITACCLSAKVAETLPVQSFRKVMIAEKPALANLLVLLNAA